MRDWRSCWRLVNAVIDGFYGRKITYKLESWTIDTYQIIRTFFQFSTSSTVMRFATILFTIGIAASSTSSASLVVRVTVPGELTLNQ